MQRQKEYNILTFDLSCEVHNLLLCVDDFYTLCVWVITYTEWSWDCRSKLPEDKVDIYFYCLNFLRSCVKYS